MRIHHEDQSMRIKEDRAGYAKRAANLSVNAELLDAAKALEINLSATLERALEEEVRARKREKWLAENREAIAAYNARIERDGMLSDHVRAFRARSRP
jgi:antitoxin CcdA